MKTNLLQKMFAVTVVAGLGLSAATALAQSASDGTAPPPASVASAPQLSGGASEILRLMKAKVGDDTIIAYIKNSANSYALNADQIIYLRQQGVSDAVIGVMLNQPKTSVAAATAVSAPQSSASTITTPSGSTATVAPTVTYVQTVPATTYYYQPYYYPANVWYPPVVFSFGWGGGWHGGGYHGGFRR